MRDGDGGGYDPIEFELFKNAIFSVADEMALTLHRTTYSSVLKRLGFWNRCREVRFPDMVLHWSAASASAARRSRPPRVAATVECRHVPRMVGSRRLAQRWHRKSRNPVPRPSCAR
jgi:hypothetical protein